MDSFGLSICRVRNGPGWSERVSWWCAEIGYGNCGNPMRIIIRTPTGVTETTQRLIKLVLHLASAAIERGSVETFRSSLVCVCVSVFLFGRLFFPRPTSTCVYVCIPIHTHKAHIMYVYIDEAYFGAYSA